jgi:P pilus assembly chaperone PapD
MLNLRYVGLVVLIIQLAFTQANAGVGISTKRIYLDNDNSTSNFVLSNRQLTPQNCALSITHYNFDEFGQMLEQDGNVLPQYPAETLFRYSPKKFNIPAKQKQTVRFTLRRRKDTEPYEHRAYLVVDCEPVATTITSNQNTSTNGMVKMTMTPKLLQNIPIIVRPKKIEASIQFLNLKLSNNVLQFDLIRMGNRSVFGKIKIFQRQSQELIIESGPVIIYLDSRQKNFSMGVPGNYRIDDLLITLDEEAKYGGDISHSWPTQAPNLGGELK